MSNHLQNYWPYVATFLTSPRYVFNILHGALLPIGAIIGLYRPHPGAYWLNFGLGVDRCANALAGGDPRETISSRAAKARAEGKPWGCVLCRFLGWCATKIAGKPTDHCAESLEANVGNEAVIPD